MNAPARAVVVVLPDGVDDPRRPSGGNVYDRRVMGELAAAGWSVQERAVPGRWPCADPSGLTSLRRGLASLPDRALVLVDGLVASAAAEVLVPAAARLRVCVLLHLPLGAATGTGTARAGERAVLQAAAAVVTTSAWSRSWVLGTYALAPDRVHVAEPGADPAPLAPGSRTGDRLLCVAAVTPGKGHDVLVAALGEVCDLSWRCVCVGSLERDPGFVDRLRRRARDTGVSARVHLAGPRTGEALAASFGSADLLVHASRFESYGMVVTEALAHGLPVLATDTGGLPGALGRLPDGRRPGLLVPPGDPAASGAGSTELAGRPDPAGVPAGGGGPASYHAGGLAHDRRAGLPGAGRGRRVRRGWTGRLRPVVAGAVLGVLLWRVGGGPFVDAVRTLDVGVLLVAAAIAVPTTVCCAWRWRLVARSLGVGIGLPAAVAAYYRSQFLNTALPGGVLGDLHRGVRHGLDAGDTGRGVRAVVWERFAGQLVQVVTTLAVLLLVPSPVHSALPVVAVVVGVLALAAVLLLRAAPDVAATRRAHAVHAVCSDIRGGLLSPATWPGVLVASLLAVCGHVATFLVAAHAAGVTASPVRLLPVALLVLLAMALPLNVAGWGPREGVAAWAFAAAGLGAGPGVTTAVVYGVLVLVAGLPGAVVLLVERHRPAAADPGARVPAADRPVLPAQEAARG